MKVKEIKTLEKVGDAARDGASDILNDILDVCRAPRKNTSIGCV